VTDLLLLGGFEASRHDIGTSSLRLDYVRPESDGKWSWKPQAGDSVAQWLMKIRDTVAANWVMGTYPRAVEAVTSSILTGYSGFRFRSKISMGTTPKATIYLHSEGVVDGSKTPCYDFEETWFPVDATSITVWGYDPRSKTLLRDRWKHPDAWNPFLAVNARSEGWVGRSIPLTVVSQRLTRPETVVAAREQLQQVLGVPTRAAKWESPLLYDSTGIPLWIGECVQIRPSAAVLPGGRAEGGIYRITDIDLSWTRKDIAALDARRLVRYEGERVGNIL
jgi:hypothetical protein